jgi:hypothetical protein
MRGVEGFVRQLANNWPRAALCSALANKWPTIGQGPHLPGEQSPLLLKRRCIALLDGLHDCRAAPQEQEQAVAQLAGLHDGFTGGRLVGRERARNLLQHHKVHAMEEGLQKRRVVMLRCCLLHGQVVCARLLETVRRISAAGAGRAPCDRILLCPNTHEALQE